jgi:hypothetical protein
MKRGIVVLLSAVLACLRAAPAPESISGTVLRERGGIASLRVLWEATILLGDDGRYTYVKAALASTLTGNWRIATPPSDGTYAYTRTGPSAGRLVMSGPSIPQLHVVQPPGNGPTILNLDFEDTTLPGGDAGSGRYEHAYFTLSRMATVLREPVANVSLRGTVAAERPLIAGFVIKGDPRDVLIRVVGPSLASFGISGYWANPRFDIYRAGDPVPIGGQPGPTRNAIAYYDDWSADSAAVPGLVKLFAHTGAFPLQAGSQDAVGVTPRLAPGAYTLVCRSETDEAGGEALVEVYVLP